MRHAAVLGRPITHSLSPVLHRAAYAALGLDWTYEAIDCGVDELPGVLSTRGDWAGFSCTMPLKRALLDVAVSVDPLAATIGAANTLTPVPGGWHASTTDVAGLIGALVESRVQPGTALLLGAGGTAQNALAALSSLDLAQIEVAVRDVSRTAELRACADRLGIGLSVRDFGAANFDADLIVSTLPSGAADPFAARKWRSDQALLDVVYDPWPTALAAAFQRAGATVVSGACMLLHQAAAQVHLMTGQHPPLEAMRAALPPGVLGSTTSTAG